MNSLRRILLLLCVVALAWTTPTLTADEDAPPPEEPPTWDLVLEYYEKAKDAGEQVPQDVYEWAKQDLAKIGDWEYRVVNIDLNYTPHIEAQLNTLGADRWECIWIEKKDDGAVIIFKRPAQLPAEPHDGAIDEARPEGGFRRIR